MPEKTNAIRLAAYVATAGTISAAKADIQVYDGPPIDLNGGNVQLELQGLGFNFATSRFTNQYNNFTSWNFCCGYGGKYYSSCTDWGGSWFSTYQSWEDIGVNCGKDMLSAGFMSIGDAVDGNVGCDNIRTDLCTFTYYTYSYCGDITYSQNTNCNDSRRFHVGFTVMQDGTEIFGWIELEGPSNDLKISRWAYEDSGAPILVGQVPVEPCIGDLNGDASVNAADLGLLLSSWGDCPKAGDCATDLNNDWSIDAADLGLILSLWGDCSDPCLGQDCIDDELCTIDACIEGQCYNVVSNFGDCSSGDCCEANGTPGCEDSLCEELVCTLLPNCCDFNWDASCAGIASILGCECP